MRILENFEYYLLKVMAFKSSGKFYEEYIYRAESDPSCFNNIIEEMKNKKFNGDLYHSTMTLVCVPVDDKCKYGFPFMLK